MNVLSEVVEKNLCISCGACEQTCPHNAISFNFIEGSFLPKINMSDCTECGLCTKVCPSYKNDLSCYTKDNIFSGDYIDVYSAQSKNNGLLMNSSSGGIVTNIITHLLERGLYKFAAVVNYDQFDNQANYTVTGDVNIVLESAKSKYVPVSVKNVLSHLKENSIDPIIIVATSCQIYSIKSFCKLKKISIDNILFLGLFCEHTLNYNIYNYYKCVYGDYDKLFFRSKYKKGWPGHTLLLKDGKHNIVDRSVRMSLKPLFKNNRCRNCFDKLNGQADISFGDHYVKGEGSLKGISSVIVRTEKGKSIFEGLKNHITYREISFLDVAESQSINNLEIEYARATLLQTNMYKNYPFVSTLTLDMGKEKVEYERLRIGALAQTYDDFVNIKKMLPRITVLGRIKNKIKRIFCRILNK